MTEINIYYMRDNHTFKKLTNDVNTALSEIEHEFNQGFTHGGMFSKAKGFRDIQATGPENRLEFFAECKAELEKWLVKEELEPVAWLTEERYAQLHTSPPKREWSDDEFIAEAKRRGFFTNAAHGIKGEA
jgi:aspartate aminotransferase-like enzyme